MGVENFVKNIDSSGIYAVIAAVFLYYVIVVMPKEKKELNAMIEKVATVVANNTEVIRETKTIHKDMEKTLGEIRDDIKELKTSTDLTSVYTMLEKLEDKINQLGK